MNGDAEVGRGFGWLVLLAALLGVAAAVWLFLSLAAPLLMQQEGGREGGRRGREGRREEGRE